MVMGALAPLPQSIREIESILLYPGLSDYLPSGEAISQISKVEDGYLLVTGNKVLKIKVIYKKPASIGPKKFSLQVIDLK